VLELEYFNNWDAKKNLYKACTYFIYRFFPTCMTVPAGMLLILYINQNSVVVHSSPI
jgi:hypothetical protein